MNNDNNTWFCEVKMKLPSLNDYINLCRGNKFSAAGMKKKLEKDIGWFLNRLPRFENPITIEFHWVEDNKRRDFDNIAFAKKFILDAMVKAGKLKDDNRRYVQGFTDSFEYGKEAMVKVIVKEMKEG